MILPLLAAQTFSPYAEPHGMVVSDNLLASQAGRDAMRRGGNAIDAAVATALALAVTHPSAGNLGGGGFMVVRLADGRAVAIDFREVAPAAASREMYVAKAADSTIGYRAVGVPGSPAGLWKAHRMFGKLPWASLVEPARKLAADGFVLSRGLARSMKGHDFKGFPASVRQFQRSGKPYTGGERFRQPDLAQTLLRMEKGPDDFYRGQTARLLVHAMKANGGLITLADLAAYTPKLRTPLRGSFKGCEVLTMPPPSSGGIALLQMLGTVDGKLSGYGSAESVHTTVEAMKRAFADRSEFLGDPDFVSVPTERLLSKGRIEEFRREIGSRATPADAIRPKLDALHEGDHTTHFSVVDGAGNAVSCTTTLNTGFGSDVVAPGTGFLLNNEMDDFASAPGRPNAYGLIQGEANAIAPHKRPLSSMTPTILTQGGKLLMVVGSPGGPTIINTVFETILDVLEYGMDVQRAVSAPRYHHQWRPDTLAYEPFAFTPEVMTALRTKGHELRPKPANQGSCHAIAILGDGWRAAGTDPRLPDAGAAGY